MAREQLIRQYVRLLEHFAHDEASFAAILHPGFEQTEFPNALNKKGQRSDRPDIFRRMRLAPSLLAKQAYDIQSIVEQGDVVVVETKWNGTMALDAGPLKRGQVLSGHMCFVLEFKDGLIFRQRNYDCFEPFQAEG